MHLLGPFSGVGEQLLKLRLVAKEIVFLLGFQLAPENVDERRLGLRQFASFGETIEERRIVAVPRRAQHVKNAADVAERRWRVFAVEGGDELRRDLIDWPEREEGVKLAGNVGDGLGFVGVAGFRLKFDELLQMAVEHHDLCEHLRFCLQRCAIVIAAMGEQPYLEHVLVESRVWQPGDEFLGAVVVALGDLQHRQLVAVR